MFGEPGKMNGLLPLRLEKVPSGLISTSPTASATVFSTAPSSPHPAEGLLLLPQRVQKQNKYQVPDRNGYRPSNRKKEKDILHSHKRQNKAFNNSLVAKSLSSLPTTPSQMIGRARSWSEASDGCDRDRDLQLPLSPRMMPQSMSSYDLGGAETPRKLSRSNSRVSVLSDSDWSSCRSSTFSRSESPDHNMFDTATDPFPAMAINLNVDDLDHELGIMDLAHVHLSSSSSCYHGYAGNKGEEEEMLEEVSLSPLPAFAFLDEPRSEGRKQPTEEDLYLSLTGPLLTRDLDDDLVCSELGSVHSDLFNDDDHDDQGDDHMMDDDQPYGQGLQGQGLQGLQGHVALQSLKKAFSPLLFESHMIITATDSMN